MYTQFRLVLDLPGRNYCVSRGLLWVMNWKGFDRKQSSVVRKCPRIWLRGQGSTELRTAGLQASIERAVLPKWTQYLITIAPHCGPPSSSLSNRHQWGKQCLPARCYHNDFTEETHYREVTSLSAFCFSGILRCFSWYSDTDVST